METPTPQRTSLLKTEAQGEFGTDGTRWLDGQLDIELPHDLLKAARYGIGNKLLFFINTMFQPQNDGGDYQFIQPEDGPCFLRLADARDYKPHRDVLCLVDPVNGTRWLRRGSEWHRIPE